MSDKYSFDKRLENGAQSSFDRHKNCGSHKSKVNDDQKVPKILNTQKKINNYFSNSSQNYLLETDVDQIGNLIGGSYETDPKKSEQAFTNFMNYNQFLPRKEESQFVTNMKVSRLVDYSYNKSKYLTQEPEEKRGFNAKAYDIIADIEDQNHKELT